MAVNPLTKRKLMIEKRDLPSYEEHVAYKEHLQKITLLKKQISNIKEHHEDINERIDFLYRKIDLFEEERRDICAALDQLDISGQDDQTYPARKARLNSLFEANRYKIDQVETNIFANQREKQETIAKTAELELELLEAQRALKAQ